MESTTRRDFLRQTGEVTLGVLIGAGGMGLAACDANKAATPPKFPWAYTKLDPTAAAERAYTAFYQGACMYGAFAGIIGELASKVGAPFNTFPMDMMKYGEGGVMGWGTLCGALNGAAAAISLLHDKDTAKSLINELYGWYGTEALPDYKPKQPKYDTIASSVSQSQLCHVSVTTWCNTSGFKEDSPERADRCGWLAASVARYAVLLMNQHGDGSFKLIHPTPAAVTTCLSCHGVGSQMVNNVRITSQTSCTACHSDLSKHPVPLK